MSDIPPPLTPPRRPAPRPGLHLVLRTATYAIAGSTGEQLRAAVDLRGPERLRTRFAAYTDWNVTWTFKASLGKTGYRVTRPRVEVIATTTLPRWNPPQGTAPELIASWDAFLDAATLHERGHVDFAIEAGHAVLDALERMQPRWSRDALDGEVDKQLPTLVAGFRRLEMRYDVITLHGAKQGVQLP